MKKFGIDTLRSAVRLFGNCNETFNQAFTGEELLCLYEMYSVSGWDITPDRWTERQVHEALRGRTPTWDDNETPTY